MNLEENLLVSEEDLEDLMVSEEALLNGEEDLVVSEEAPPNLQELMVTEEAHTDVTWLY